MADAINQLKEETKMAIIIVSHYERFLELVAPQFTHVLVNGKIVLDGDASLVKRIDQEGYDWIYKEYGVTPEIEEPKKRPTVSLGTCAVSQQMRKGEK